MKNHKIYILVLTFFFINEVYGRRRIFGGVKAIGPEFSYVALFSYKVDKFKVVAPICGGAIINEKHILTASHCLGQPKTDYKTSYMVMVGSKYAEVDEGDWYYIKKVFLTEKQKQLGPPVDDIALIRIWGEFQFGTFVQPIALSSSSRIPVGRTGTVVGWGQYIQTPQEDNSGTLLAVQMTVVHSSRCEEVWNRFDSAFNICVESPYTTGTCNGDSGGPLVIDNVLYGLLSYGHADCGNGVPEVYINVGVYYDWIQSKIAL